MAAEIQVRSDSSPVLKKGFATPYLAIFNSQLSVIRDPNNNMPLGTFVTHFEYTYNEEKTDTGKIDIETNNPDLIALTELSYGQGLQLQWGYIYQDGTGYYGPVRKVIITNSEVSFGQSGIKITLTISDPSILLKNSPSNHFDNTKGFVKYLEDLCKGIPITNSVDGITLVDYNSYNVVRPLVAKKVTSGQEAAKTYPNVGLVGGKSDQPSPLASPKEGIQIPTMQVPDAVGVKLLEYNAETQKLVIDDPDNFRKVYLQEKLVQAGLIVGTSRSKYHQLKDVCRSLNGGPYFVDSRDGKVILHNVKSQRGITKVYTYMGGNGELLEFSVKTDYVKTSVEVKQSTEIDPDSKSIKTNFVQAVVDPDQGNKDGKDIDTYMVWRDSGTPSFNPIGPNWVGNSMYLSGFGGKNKASSKDRKGSEYHVMLDESLVNNKVKATEEKPKVKSKFNSISQARKYYITHPKEVSQAEIEGYFNQWMSEWKSGNQATDPDSMSEKAHQLDRIPPMKIKRDVQITAEVNMENIGRHLFETGTSVEAFANSIASGQVDLNHYKGSGWADGAIGPTGQYSRAQLRKFGQNGVKVFESIPGFTCEILSPDKDESGHYKPNRMVLMKGTMEIDMNGVDVVAGADTLNIAEALGNDIVDKVTNKVKASAKVIGDPVLESSMNLQIQNVSSKYNGLWYTKKVTHTIDSSGYTCDIEFVQRNIPVSTVTLKSNWTKRDYGKQILSAMKQAAKTGDYKTPSSIEASIKSHLQATPGGSSIVIQMDPTTGKQIRKEVDLASPYYNTRENGEVDYINRATEYIQDLQKKVDKLPE